MGFYNLELDELSAYSGIAVDELKNKSYSDLEGMIAGMKRAKIIERNNANAQDAEYERIVLKYFEPMDMLRQWFDEREIVLACAMEGVTLHDLCREVYVEPGRKCHYSNSEFVRNSVEYVPQYDKMGRELMERASKRVDVYRVASQYQGSSCHGKVVLRLLYGRYPELAEFGFSAYGMHAGEMDYEIYPVNGIYTPLMALMSGNVDWILFRNREYCKWYNNGRYSPEQYEEALRSENVRKMLDLVRRIGEEERSAGRILLKDWDDPVPGTRLETKVLDSGNVAVFSEPKRDGVDRTSKKYRFWIGTAAPYAVGTLLKEYLEGIDPAVVKIHIRDAGDFLSENALHLDIRSDWFGKLDIVAKDGTDCSGYAVHSAFGWKLCDAADLTVVVDCPALAEK